MPDTDPVEPIFGHAIRHEWMLEDDVVYLNHGSYGATPRTVLAAQHAWREALEREPCRFMRRELPPALAEARRALADFVGADPDNLVFVDNATTGVNAVIGSLDLNPDDEVVTTSHAYGAVRKALAYHCERRGARLVEVALPFPLGNQDEILRAVELALTARTRLAVLDHVSSDSALVFPVARLGALCGARDVPLLVDGAHAAGMLPLELEHLGADWYAASTHKWLCAPKGSGFLWTRPERQAETHPVVISHGLGQGYAAEFGWQGTRDYSPWLSLSAALAFRARLGEARLSAYCGQLAGEAADLLAGAWGTELGTPAALRGFMANVHLPSRTPGTLDIAHTIRTALLRMHGIEAQIVALAGALWVRISAQVYNDISDFSHLAEAVPLVLAQKPWRD